jgi:hypothetical protein
VVPTTLDHTAAATKSPPQAQITPTPAPTSTVYQGFTEEQQANWLYISSRHVPYGAHAGQFAPAWKANWREVLKHEIGAKNTTVDLSKFKRVLWHKEGNRIVLEAPGQVDRRALQAALRSVRSKWRCVLHLSPQGKANKTLVYY